MVDPNQKSNDFINQNIQFQSNKWSVTTSHFYSDSTGVHFSDPFQADCFKSNETIFKPYGDALIRRSFRTFQPKPSVFHPSKLTYYPNRIKMKEGKRVVSNAFDTIKYVFSFMDLDERIMLTHWFNETNFHRLKTYIHPDDYSEKKES